MHTLIDVAFNQKEKKRLRKWSGSCSCKQWNGQAPTEKFLRKMHAKAHKKNAGIIL